MKALQSLKKERQRIIGERHEFTAVSQTPHFKRQHESDVQMGDFYVNSQQQAFPTLQVTPNRLSPEFNRPSRAEAEPRSTAPEDDNPEIQLSALLAELAKIGK